MRSRTKWNYINEDELTRQINEIEIKERQARQEAEGKQTYGVRSINPFEDNLALRIDATSQGDTSDTRQQTLIKEVKKIRAKEDEYIGIWEKQNRKTMQAMRALDEKELLLREQRRLQAEIAAIRQ